MTKPWEEFTAGKGAPSAANDEWGQLTWLTHGTHLTEASRIAEDGRIAGGLIYDGKLRTTRTEVIYFSPNTWHGGSRYGAFDFVVEWETLAQGRSLYWVEAIKSYKIPIYRFLLSQRNPVGLAVTPYDPKADLGPIRQIGTEWFWARGYAAEVVIDEAWSLSDTLRLNFVKHHDDYCSLKNRHCPEAGWGKSWRKHAAFMGWLLGRGLVSLNEQLVEAGKVSDEAQSALGHLHRAIIDSENFGGPIADDENAKAVVRAAGLLMHGGQLKQARQVMALIDTEDRASRVFRDLVADQFGFSSFEFE